MIEMRAIVSSAGSAKPRPCRHGTLAGGKWEFHSEHGLGWRWRLVDRTGRTIAHNARHFASYFRCLENARRYGYLG